MSLWIKCPCFAASIIWKHTKRFQKYHDNPTINVHCLYIRYVQILVRMTTQYPIRTPSVQDFNKRQPIIPKRMGAGPEDKTWVRRFNKVQKLHTAWTSEKQPFIHSVNVSGQCSTKGLFVDNDVTTAWRRHHVWSCITVSGLWQKELYEPGSLRSFWRFAFICKRKTVIQIVCSSFWECSKTYCSPLMEQSQM